MSLTSVLFTYIISVITFLILPGPVNLFVVNSTLKYGIKGSLLAILGTNLASLVLIVIAGFLIAGADFIDTRILDILTFLGGLFLLYYGLMQVRDTLKKKPVRDIPDSIEVNPKIGSYSPIKLISQAFAIGISNPKDVIFFIAFFPPFILQMGFSIPYSLLILTIIWCILDYTLLLTFGLLANHFLKGSFEKIFSFLCGVLFCGIGCYAIYLAITEWGI